MSEARIGFYGATKEVTGSCFLLEIRGLKILIDCGMFQGREAHELPSEFPFSPKKIDYLILTHAHIDHCGRIPLLVREGFKGKIISTRPTAQIARIMLLDSAKVMREHYKVLLRKAKRKGRELPSLPLYDEYDVVESFPFFEIQLPYERPFNLSEDIKITFKDAGHILGSCFVEIEDLKARKKFIFSGDLGNKGKPIVRDYTLPSAADFVFMETTYGDRNHKPFEESKKELLEAICETFKNGGNVLIPTFALERAQEILFILREFHEAGELPPCQVFLDSPLAIKATRIFEANPEFFDENAYQIFQRKDPFDLPGLHFTEDVEESKAINNIRSGAIIIAGNGTLTGGRILHHLKNNIWREECSLVFVGFQPRGTLGRKIVEGADKIHLFGEEVAVRLKVYTINGFSSHADQRELLEWVSYCGTPEKLFLIHGEEDKMQIFKSALPEDLQSKVYIPSFSEEIELY